MTFSERARRHLRSNVVGYIALFVALSGTALALPGKNSVKSNDIARGAVKGKALADAAVAREKIRDGAVTSSKLDDGSVITQKLADSAVTSPKLAEDSVTRSKIGQGEINGGKLANGAINSAKVADGTLLGEDFAPGQLSEGFLDSLAPTFDDSGWTTIGPADASFTTQRPGPLFVTATFLSSIDCTTGTCGREFVIEVDNTDVPGTGRSIATPAATSINELVSLIGLTPSLAAGSHEIDLQARTSGGTGTAAEGQVSLGGILLQQ